MKVGLKLDVERSTLASLRRIARTTWAALAERHEVVFLPREYPFVSPGRQARMAEAFVAGCDVMMGVFDPAVLAARGRLESGVPFVSFTYGDLANGAWGVREVLAEVTTRDVMLVSCASEVELAGRLFANARVRVIPFAFDPEVFFPLGEGEKRAARERLGFGAGEAVLLYAGRIIPEKNVHVLLTLFDLVAARVPGARLVLAGQVGAAALGDFGVQQVSPSATLSRLIGRLERRERVSVVVPRDDRALRELYNAADLKVNLTLSPDENFGLGQVEAMACGTPVVGTAWGGLKDTIRDGVTGCAVTTAATPTGVKLDWWEAANRIVGLLEDAPARERMGRAAVRAARDYTPRAFGAMLDRVVTEAVEERAPAEAVRPTPFAEELWSVCDPRWPGPLYRRGARSEQLQRELVAPFAAASPSHVAPGEPLEPGQVLSLATPVHPGAGGRFRLDHLYSPVEVQAPVAPQAVDAVLACLRRRPAIASCELLASVGGVPGVRQALAWLLEAGVLLRTRAAAGWMDPTAAGEALARPAFTVCEIDRGATDMLVFH